MYLTEEKLYRRIGALERLRYRDVQLLGPWHYRPDAGQNDTEREVTVGDRWSGRDVYATLTGAAAVPGAWAGRRAVGLFDFGRTGAGNNSGFESLLTLDGQLYQAVDSNHQEVLLPQDAAGRTLALSFRLWSGLEGGGPPRAQHYEFRRADLAWLDPDADALYFTARAMLDAAHALGANDPIAVRLLEDLNRAVNRIDLRSPGSPECYRSIAAVRAELDRVVSEYAKDSPVTITTVGHCHMDVAWLWRLRHTREKAARAFTTVLRLMEEYPEYTYFQSQPQLYAWVKEDQPALYERVRQRIQEGRWEPDGAMWLEADSNLTGGESLVRQVLFGTRFFAREFGREPTVLWLPDAFGYSAALPQVLVKAGIRAFVTTKISWNQYNRFPHDTFRWRGIDGSEVLGHFITTPSPRGWDRDDRWMATYNGEITAGTVLGSWRKYQDKGLNQNLLLAFGYGDGGGGPNREMLEMRRALDRIPGLPRLTPGRVDGYLAELQKTMEEASAPVPVWDGELYLEYHRGTYTSQAAVKRANRELELLLREAEWWASWAFAARAGWDEAQARLNEAWRIVLTNQFHDILPGSSIQEVYEDAARDYRTARAAAAEVFARARALLLREEVGCWTILNGAPWRRSGVVRIPAGTVPFAGRLVDESGTALSTQKVDEDLWVEAPLVAGMGAAAVSARPDPGTEETGSPLPFRWEANILTTPFYRCVFDENGRIAALEDLRHNREVIASGRVGNLLEVFEDMPVGLDAWDIDLFYQEKSYAVERLETLEIKSVGPVAAVVRLSWRYQQSRIEQDVVFYAKDPRIDFKTRVDWHEHHQLLKVAFPVAVRAREAHYAIQFGHLARPTHWNTPWDQARFEVVGHQWADLSEHGYGVALLNDSKYGYDIRDGVMRLSLIKSATYPDPDADQGEHRFTYALLPHAGDLVEGGVPEAAWDLNSPLRPEAGRLDDPRRPVWVEGEHVQISAVKRAEDGDRVVVRLYEWAGGRTTVRLGSDREIRGWQRIDLRERPEGPREIGDPVLELGPFEIQTVLLDLA